MSKVAIFSFSGNVGKSTVAKHLFLPRMPGATFVAVESINSDEGGGGDMVRGDQFGQLQEQLLMLDSAVIDIGASNVEDFSKLMRQYRGSHEDFDFFIVPTVKDNKQIKDTIATISALKAMGVPAKKIRVIFNKLEANESVDEAFYPLIQFHEQTKAFTLRMGAAVEFSELFQKLRMHKTSIPELIADTTDYKAKLRDAKDQDEKLHCINMISMRRLALSAQENLDNVYAAITK